MKTFGLYKILGLAFVFSAIGVIAGSNLQTAHAALRPNQALCSDGSIIDIEPGQSADQRCRLGGFQEVTSGYALENCTFTSLDAFPNADQQQVRNARKACIEAGPPDQGVGGDNNEPVPCQREDTSVSLFGIPPWYKYLEEGAQTAEGTCGVVLTSLNDIWKIVLAVFEALLRIAGYIAVAMMIYGGFVYTTSQGEPEKTKQAMGTIRIAAIGLLITIASTVIVSFVAGSF